MDNDNKRIDIEDLPKAAEELSADEEKGVTGGGPAIGGMNVCMADGSVRLNNTVGGSLSTNKEPS
jgi:prepilin-type processing-associated H-X9-DG protein